VNARQIQAIVQEFVCQEESYKKAYDRKIVLKMITKGIPKNAKEYSATVAYCQLKYPGVGSYTWTQQASYDDDSVNSRQRSLLTAAINCSPLMNRTYTLIGDHWFEVRLW
jgi:hypothetical protein